MGFKTTIGLKLALSLLQQTAYGTGLSNAAIDKAHTVTSDDIPEMNPEKINDAKEYGKGHGYATQAETIANDISLSMNFRGSSFILPWVFGLVTGNITTSQPDEVGSPNVYLHEMKVAKFADLLQLPVTTIIQGLSSDMIYKYRDVMITSVSLSGKTKEHLMIQVNAKTSGHREKLVSFTFPALVATKFLKFMSVNFLYGAANISAKLKDLTYSISAAVDENDGYHPGCPTMIVDDLEIPVRGRLLRSDESGVELKFKMLLEDDSLDTDSLKNTKRAITITAEGAPIDTAFKHKLLIEIPGVTLKTAKIGKENNLYIYDTDVEFLFDEALDSVCKISVWNDIPAYLGTPA